MIQLKIVISGKQGYLANQLKKYIGNKNSHHEISLISLRDEEAKWNLHNTDVFIHTSALVHKKEAKFSIEDYYKVNTDLTIELAKEAKVNGIKQFVFISSMSVFGTNEICINEKTKLEPTSHYGKSKLAAEEELKKIESPDFTITIVRPPMIYGLDCPGNYKSLSKYAKLTFVFPLTKNKRSMIYIDNLCEFVFQAISNNDRGIYHPQDSEYINTSVMVKEIALANKHKLYLSMIAGKFLKVFIGKSSIYKKIFGNLYYSKELSMYRNNEYQKFSFKEAINIIESGERK
ncbi:NAD-dependent epimerase/dehydratase family protein [Planococcus kocurii]|uniref:NAD-dependent epimerase/dehydratase family protein n=1 Tax=Planococcus kocurii TaxID=1374 RepID=UPI003D0394D2